MFQNYTERKRTEEELRQTSQYLNSLITYANAPIIVWNPEFRITQFNQAFERITGREAATVLGNSLEVLFPADQAAVTMDYIRRTSSVGEHWETVEIPIQHVDGSVKIVLWNSASIYGQDGKALVATIAQGQDITERKRTEDNLIIEKEKALASVRSKSEFLANMSHEIRTPLNGIVGMLHLMNMSSLDEEQKEYVDAAVRSSARLTQLLSDILDVSRIESGKFSINEASFALSQIEEALRDLFEIIAKEKGVDLQFTIDGRLPKILDGDENRLVQVLFNVVGNAIKFSDKSPVHVGIYLLPFSVASYARVLFVVSDKGVGISDDYLQLIFEPFTQEEPYLRKRFQGAGLGLAIVRKIVTAMGGGIAIDNSVGEGTTFYVSIPFRLPLGERAPALLIPSAHEVVHKIESVSKKRILLVEDDGMNLFVGKTLLEKSGCFVVTAKNGQESIDIYKKQDFDLILMDIQMPVMNGLEATEAIRDSSLFGIKSRVPIIAFTAYVMPGDKEKILAVGIDDYISKPVNWREVITKIERYAGESDVQQVDELAPPGKNPRRAL